ncbi:hypothetical protein IKE83_01390 [Candidatus Saccharibacteria bacterium]|nr:hypothetical protein [Candidatus Saccharibacteria bacterium]
MVKFWRGRNIILAGGTMLAGIFGAQAVSADNSGISFTVSVPDVPVLEISVYDEDGNLMTDGQETLMEVTPTMALAGFNTTGMKVTVGTSSAAGYKLAMQVANDGTLVSENSDVIPSLASDEDESGNKFTCTTATAASCNFTVNSWGYWMTGDEANAYKPVPSVQTQLVNYTAGATDGEDTDFAFAVRANAKQAAGDYETTINFIATANPETTIHSLQYMQDFNVLVPDEYAAVVESMTEDESYELVDNRDNTTYNVAKLADGNVWLMDNLSLDLVNVSLADLQGNTNASNETLAKLKNGGGSFPYTTAKVVETSSFGTSGDAYTAAKINSSYGSYNKNSEWLYDGTNKGKQGIYYNYCAASAGSYCYMSGNPSSDPDTTTLIDAKEDICPAGWRMPTGGDSGEYQNLCTVAWGQSCTFGMDMSYSDAKSIQSVLHAPLSGNFYGSSTNNQGNSGNFWSSTYYNSSSMYGLGVSNSKSWAQNNNDRNCGYSVRCVLKSNENNVAINFNGNGATSGENRTLGYKAGSGATIPGAGLFGFEKAGKYGFAGWNTKADGSGTSYAVNAAITAGMNGLTLYAQWQEVTIAMQDLTYAACPATPIYVYDNRDDKVYLVQRLKLTTSDDNGLCWMLDNLQLDISANKDNITSTNTNANNDVLTCLKSGCSSSTTYSKVAAANTNASTWSGDIRYTQAMYNTEYANYDASYGNGTHKSGYYYNYCAASAGSYCYAKSSAPANTNASQDVCPAGWQMPEGNTSTYSYKKLYEAYGSNAADFKNALHAGLSGYFLGGVGGQGSHGYFWATTFYDTSSMRNLAVTASSVTPQTSYYRYLGYSVRCVLKATS